MYIKDNGMAQIFTSQNTIHTTYSMGNYVVSMVGPVKPVHNIVYQYMTLHIAW